MKRNSHDDWFKGLTMGDKKAFERLVEETQNMVCGIVYSHTQDSSITEDLAQDTYLKAFVSLNGLKDPQKIRSWLSSIAHHTAIDWVRKKKERPSDTNRLSIAIIESGQNQNIEETERRVVLIKAMQDLEPDEREILILRYMEQLSYKEIANTLNMTVTAVGEKLCRLRHKLEEKLKSRKEDVL